MTCHPLKECGYGHVTVFKFCRLPRCSASRGFVCYLFVHFCTVDKNSDWHSALLIADFLFVAIMCSTVQKTNLTYPGVCKITVRTLIVVTRMVTMTWLTQSVSQPSKAVFDLLSFKPNIKQIMKVSHILPRDAMLVVYAVIVCLSVCLFVCLSQAGATVPKGLKGGSRTQGHATAQGL